MPDLARTLFTARYDEPMPPPRRNVLWCGTFQLCWDALSKTLGGPPKLHPEPELAASLNRRLTAAADVDDASVVALSGFGREGILDRVRGAVRARFDIEPELLPSKVDPDDILAYAMLYKNLEFETPFEEGSTGNFAGTPIARFGVGVSSASEPDPRRHAQVPVLRHKSGRDCAVELRTRSEGGRLILARVEPAATLERTVERTLEGLGPPDALRDDDVLAAPKPAAAQRLIVSRPRRQFFTRRVRSLTIENPDSMTFVLDRLLRRISGSRSR